MNNNTIIKIPCPACGQETKQSVGWLKSNDSFTCICGKTTRFEGEEIVRNAQTAIDNFVKNRGAFFK